MVIAEVQMGTFSGSVVESWAGDGLSIYGVLALLVVTGLLANAYAEWIRRRRLRETRGVDDMLPY